MSEVITSPFHAYDHYPTNRIFGFAKSDQSKVTPDDIRGLPIFHYSIPNVQEFADGALEDGSSVKSDKVLISEPCVLISKLNPRKATIALANPQDELTVASTEFVPISTNSARDNRYLYWVLNSGEVTRYLSSLVSSATNSHQRVDPSEIIGLRVPWPSEPERYRIAAYLDRETDQIDAMFDRLGELAEALEIRRLAAIDSAFAGARQPVDTAFQMVADVTVGIVIQPSKLYVYGGDGVPALRGLNIAPGQIIDKDIVRISTEGHQANLKSELREGDLVTVRTGQVGVTAIVPPAWDGANAIDLVISRPHPGVSSRYLYWFLCSSLSRSQMDAETVGAVQSHFNVSSLKRLRTPIVDEAEQRRIADHLDDVTSKIDEMLAKVAQLKDLLTERRAALITDVVTGRKDVA